MTIGNHERDAGDEPAEQTVQHDAQQRPAYLRVDRLQEVEAGRQQVGEIGPDGERPQQQSADDRQGNEVPDHLVRGQPLQSLRERATDRPLALHAAGNLAGQRVPFGSHRHEGRLLEGVLYLLCERLRRHNSRRRPRLDRLGDRRIALEQLDRHPARRVARLEALGLDQRRQLLHPRLNLGAVLADVPGRARHARAGASRPARGPS